MSNELKFIKLYEAFQSEKLSKTLAFINSSSRKIFIDELGRIASSIDFPESEYSDKYFQYLPFQKALDLNFRIEDEPCDATSAKAFPQYSVEGETCQKGMIKRKWGTTTRSVACPVCGGSGVKKRTHYDTKWIKFWFSRDGEYIAKTGTDGKIREQRKDIFSSQISDSMQLSDYNIGTDNLRIEDLKRLQIGTKVYAKLESYRSWIIGTIWRGRGESIYVIQNDHNGSTDDSTDEWKKFGEYSWICNGRGDYIDMKLLTPKFIKPKEEEIDDKPDPYTWNAPLRISTSYGPASLSLGESNKVSKELSGAHFAIVLDYLELKKSSFKGKREIGSERAGRKEGALAFKKAEDIKDENIKRYLAKIASELKISSDIGDFNKTIVRFCGGRYLGIYVLRARVQEDFNRFISDVYGFMLQEDETAKIRNYNSALNRLDAKISSNFDFNKDLTASINELRGLIMGVDDAKERKVYDRILDEILNLNKIINDKFQNMKFESVEDLEIIVGKMKTIRNIYRESDRLPSIRKVYYITERMESSQRALSYMRDIDWQDEEEVKEIFESIERFKKIIIRL